MIPELRGFFGRNILAANALVFVKYFMLAVLALLVFRIGEIDAWLWPAAGLSIASVMLSGYRILPGIFLGRIAAGLAVGSSISIGGLALLALGEVAGAAAALFFLRRLSTKPSLPDIGSLMRYAVFGGLIGCGISALVSLIVHTSAEVGIGLADVDRLAILLFGGRLLGVIMLGPFLQSWVLRGLPERLPMLLTIVATMLALSALLVVLGNSPYLRLFHLFPFLIWAALTFELRGASLAVLLLISVITGAYAAGTQILSSPTDVVQGLWILQQYLFLLSGVALIVGVIDLDRRERDQDRLRLAMEAARLGQFEVNINRNSVRFDPQVAQILGVKEEGEWQGSRPAALEFFHPDDRSRVNAAFNANIPSGGRTIVVEPRLASASQSDRWIALHGRVYEENDAMGAVSLVARGTIRDITDRKRVERRVRDHERFLRSILNSLTAWVAVVGPDGTVIEANDGTFGTESMPAVRLIGSKIWDEALWGADKDVVDTIRNGITEARLDGKVERFDIQFERDGQTVWLDIQISPLAVRDNTENIVVSGIDISSRKKAEELSRQLDAIIEATPDFVAIGTPSGEALYVNPGGLRLLDLDHDGNSPTPDGVPNLMADLPPEAIRTAFRTGEWTGEATLAKPDGTLVPVSTVLLVHRDHGQPSKISTIMRDVSEQKQAQRQQELLMRELSHRVKNTLAVIQGMARQTLATAPDAQTFTELFLGRVQSLAASHALLTEKNWRAPSMQEVIDSQLIPLLDRHIDRLVIEGEQVELPTETATQLGLVLHELGTNALKHGALAAKGGRLHISWWREADKLVIDWKERSDRVRTNPEKVVSGFGSRLLRMTASSLETTHEDDGIRVRFEVDLPEQFSSLGVSQR